jgi:lipopolysaccharide transport system permease protein
MAQPLTQPQVLELGPKPTSISSWLRAMWDHRGVTWILARKDFQVRYKRATLGVLWAVAMPLLQAAVMAVVFSHFVKVSNDIPYGAFVMAGVLPWGYFSGSMPVAATAIVDGAAMTDKVWFPRAILPIVPNISGLVGLAISMAALIVAAPLLGASLGPRVLLLFPACLLLVAFTTSLGVVLSGLQVYFRDVRFIAAAAILVWIYVTPILYPKHLVGRLGPWLDFNPMTGVIALFHMAIVGSHEAWGRSVIVSVVTTLCLFFAGVESQRRHDRLFVDLL